MVSCPVFRELLDDGIVLRVVLRSSARIDCARDAQAIEFAHEMARRIELIVEREFRSSGERRIENGCVGLRQQKAGGIARCIANDLPARRLGRIPWYSRPPQCRSVEDRSVVQMQDEYRRLRRDRVQFLDGRKSLLDELVFGETPNDAHPLRRRSNGHLPLQHAKGVGEAPYAVPAQLHVEIEPAADDVEVVVDQAWQDTLALQIDDPCGSPASGITSGRAQPR